MRVPPSWHTFLTLFFLRNGYRALIFAINWTYCPLANDKCTLELVQFMEDALSDIGIYVSFCDQHGQHKDVKSLEDIADDAGEHICSVEKDGAPGKVIFPLPKPRPTKRKLSRYLGFQFYARAGRTEDDSSDSSVQQPDAPVPPKPKAPKKADSPSKKSKAATQARNDGVRKPPAAKSTAASKLAPKRKAAPKKK
jgi:hypothetical protein